MKTILLATDYSKAANNALHYAIDLAKFTKANLVLFHAYHIPVPLTDAQMVMPVTFDNLENENKEAIKRLQNKIEKQTQGKIKTESIISSGMPVEEILNAAKSKKVDLIVMGIKGVGKLTQTLVGSTATFLMKKTTIPVLVIPDKAKFSKARKIVLAYDYQQPIKKEVLKNLREFARIFKAEVMVLHVASLAEEPNYKQAAALVKLKSALRGIKHNFSFPASENTTDEINSFIKKQKAGMLVMLPHKYSFLENLFYHSSDTKRMAFQTTVPLLSFHD